MRLDLSHRSGRRGLVLSELGDLALELYLLPMELRGEVWLSAPRQWHVREASLDMMVAVPG